MLGNGHVPFLGGRDDGNIILLPDRSFLGWYRHVTLVMRASAYLTGMCREETAHLLCVGKAAPTPLTLLVLPLTVRCPCAICSDTSSG